MKIGIVEDHLLIREFVKKICLAEIDIEIVAEASTGREAVARLAISDPEIVILDVELPDFDGLEVLSRIRVMGHHPRVVVLSSHGSAFLVYRLEQAMVQGFVDKRKQTISDLQCAIRAVCSNRTYYSASYLEIRNRMRHDPVAFNKLLTNQQIVILAMVADLIDDSTIAAQLLISERTVEAHRMAIMHKLGVHSRTELIRVAHAQGFSSIRAANA